MIRRADLVVIASGFAAGVSQVLLIRELLVACFGNELALGLTLAMWLLCSAVGVGLAVRLRSPQEALSGYACRILKLVGLLVPALILGIVFARVYGTLASTIPMRLADLVDEMTAVARILRVYVAAQPGEMLGPLHVILISLGTVAFPAVLHGALFSVALHLYQRVRRADGGTAGRVYGFDAVGHLIGGVILGWAVVTALNPMAVCCVAIALLWLAALSLASATGVHVRGIAAGSVLAFAAVLVASIPIHRVSSSVRWRDREVLDEVNSVYGRITVVRQGSEGVVFFQNGVPAGSSPGLPGVENLVQFTMLQHPDPQRVLMIGGGAMGGLRQVLKHDPARVDYAEIDPALLQLAEKWVTEPDRRALHAPAVNTLTLDGRLVVKQAAMGERKRYDVIVVMLPDPSTALLNRFYTAEWFSELSAALTPEGVVGWQIPSSTHHFRPSLLLLNCSIMKAAESASPSMVMMPGDDTLTIAAGNEQAKLSDEYGELMRRMQQRGVAAGHFAAVARDFLRPANKHFVLSKLAQCPAVPPNTDLRPIAYYYDQAVWLGYYFPALERAYVRLARLRLLDILWSGLVFFGILVLASAFRGGRTAYVPITVLATGAIGMALELSIIYAFQCSCGYVYRLVGVIIGAFMIGLAAGSTTAGSWLRTGPDHGRIAWAIVGVQIGVAGVAFCLPLVLGQLAGKFALVGCQAAVGVTLFSVLTAIVGVLVGAQFPIAAMTTAAEYEERFGSDEGQAKAASLLYAADLVGASLGAVTLSAIFIPVLGISQTCAAAACLAGAVTILLTLRAIVIS